MRIGVDLGGTKIEAIALDTDGRELARPRVKTPSGDYDATILAIRDIVLRLEGQLERRGTVGIGMPGAVSPATGLVKNANSTWLNGRPLNQDLATALRRPIRLANDANCLALSEATDGAGQGKAVIFAVVLGTGVGGGIAVHQQILNGHQAIAGEWGHNPLPWPSQTDLDTSIRCYCGKMGCIETYVSGPAIERSHAARTGQTLPLSQISRAAEEGKPEAVETITLAVRRLAQSLAGAINVLDPDIIVLGGGVSNLARLYAEVPILLERFVFSDRCTTPVVQARWGDSSGVRGAAWLWPPARAGIGQ